MKSVVLAIMLFISCAGGTLSAQTTPREPSFGDLFEQMKQMIDDFRKGGGLRFNLPDEWQADSLGNGFFFRLDTSITFGDELFRNMPNMQGEGMYGMQDFFRKFENMGRLFGIPEGIDDGDSRTEEDLLPEEQMRQKENAGEQPEAKKPAPKPKPAPKNQKPARETIRI